MIKKITKSILLSFLIILTTFLSSCFSTSDVLCASYECADIILIVEIGELVDETTYDSGNIDWEFQYTLIESLKNNTNDELETITLDNTGLGPDYVNGTETFLPEPNLGDIYIVYITVWNGEPITFHNTKLDNYDINVSFADQIENYENFILPE